MTGNTRIIKRYANRKLYDTRDSRYVTLDQIAEMVRRGEDVKVIDNSSKDDLTSVTLAQIIFEQEKRRHSFLPLSALRRIIQSGGESLQEFVTQLQESAERVGHYFHRERQDEGDEPGTDPETGGASDPTKAEGSSTFREFVDGVQQTIDDLQKRIDTHVHSALESVSPVVVQKQVRALRERIAELEQRLKRTTSGEETTDSATPEPASSDAAAEQRPER